MKHLFTLLLLVLPLSADQVTLNNGDRITGKIVKKDAGALVFKSDLLGEVTIKWENVTAVATDQPVFVVLPDGNPASGKLSTVSGQVQLADPSDPARTRQIPLAQVQTIRDTGEQKKYERYLHPPITDLWAGYVDLGLATAQGNSRTLVFTTAFNATRATNHDTFSARLNQIYSRGLIDGKVVDTAKAIRGGWIYNRNLTPRFFINVFNDYENDAFQNLDLRFVAGGGAGLNIWKKERGVLDVVLGGNYVRDKFSVPLTLTPPFSNSRQAAEAYWGDDLTYKLRLGSSLKQSFRMFNNLSNTGEYRVNFDLGIDTKIAKWLSWQITGSDRYLTNPSPGRKTNDLLISTGVRVSFAR